MKNNINVLIIEDDFWIAGIHKEQVEEIPSFNVCQIAKSKEEALTFLKRCPTSSLPHLILLDIYIPDVCGLDLFKDLRSTYNTIDIIVITAANDYSTIMATKRGGAFDYIIKPVDEKRFNFALNRYAIFFEQTRYTEDFNQQDVDQIFHVGPELIEKDEPNLPKGIDPLTLEEIITFLENDAYDAMTATDISKSLGMSRSTIRRYMEYLVSINKAKAELNYGNIGRPLRQYIYHKQNEQNK